MSIQSSAESRRERMFEWNRDNAKWGLFSTSAPVDGQPICGVCGEVYEDQLAKAHHLAHVHDAIVRVVNDGTLYEWWRP
jgi:hypothetical protein